MIIPFILTLKFEYPKFIKAKAAFLHSSELYYSNEINFNEYQLEYNKFIESFNYSSLVDLFLFDPLL